jgi:hypothetical protein
MRRFYIHAITLTATALLLSASSAVAGPPWISVEFPSNPHHPSTRDATFLIRAYHHSTSIDVPISATLEGLIGGVRKSMPARVAKTNMPGVFAVHAEVPAEGVWVAAVTLAEGEHSMATALVTLGRNGRVMSANVPSSKTKDGWVVPRAATAEDIQAELREATKLADTESGNDVKYAGVGAGLALLAFAAAFRRRSRSR